MSLFAYYLCYLSGTSLYGLILLRIYHYTFLYQDPIQIPLGIGTALLVLLVLVIIVGSIQHGIIKKFEKAVKHKDLTAAKKYYDIFSIPTIIAYSMGFFVGVGATNILESVTGKIEFDLIAFIIMVLQGIPVGLLCYTITIYKVKIRKMADMMIKAGARNVNTNVNSILHVSIFASIFLSTMNFIIVPTGLLKNPVENPMLKFLIYCIIAAIVNSVTCIISYRTIINSIQGRDKELKNHLFEQTQNLSVAAKESAATGQDQNAAVKEIVATVEDNNSLSENIHKKIKDVTDLANKSKDDVISGIESLQKNVNDLLEITESNKQTIEGIKNLGAKVNNIWDIVKLINEVAAQAKIIAFNAELEASAAGPAGKNFHIVATEVRRLSDNIIDSTHEVKEKVEEVQKSSDELILAGEQGSQKIESGYKNAKALEERFESIKGSAEVTATASSEINEYIKQMTVASEQILIAMKQIASGIDNFSQSTENISKSSEVLKDVTSLL